MEECMITHFYCICNNHSEFHVENVLHRIYELNVVFDLESKSHSFGLLWYVNQTCANTASTQSLLLQTINCYYFTKGGSRQLRKEWLGHFPSCCCFANLNPSLFCSSLYRRRRPCSLIGQGGKKIKRVCLFCIKACLSYFLTPHPSHERNSRGAFCV